MERAGVKPKLVTMETLDSHAAPNLSKMPFPVAAAHFFDLVSEASAPPPFLGPPPQWALGLVLSSCCQDLALLLASLSYFQCLPFHAFLFPVFLSLLSLTSSKELFSLPSPLAPFLPCDLNKETHGTSVVYTVALWRATNHCNG